MSDNAKIIGLDAQGQLIVPDEPIIAYIEGDGVGQDIWKSARPIFDAAIAKAYKGKRKVAWKELLAGEKAHAATGEWLPEETLEGLRKYRVSIKGPLATPVGGGIRSLNVTIRQKLDLYACIRPVRYIEGVSSPVKEPWKVNMVIFRENTEDVYAGIEWASESAEANKVIAFLSKEFGSQIRPGSGIGIKPMSPFCSKRLVRRAVLWALAQGEKSVTLVHKGNIMKFTEGGFRAWGYELCKEEFAGQSVTESEVNQGASAEGKLLIKDRIADAMFQEVLIRPEEYAILATSNLNGDYISDALAAQVGGLGMAPGANVGDEAAVFEATHGTAPTIAGKDIVNPGSFLLSGALMFDHLGWNEAAKLIREAIGRTILKKTVTVDLAKDIEGATTLKCSEFAKAIVENM